jgi:hypothetical protein
MGLWDYFLDWLRRRVGAASCQRVRGAGIVALPQWALSVRVEWLTSGAFNAHSLFWKEEMELSLIGLNAAGKTSLVNVIAVRAQSARRSQKPKPTSWRAALRARGRGARPPVGVRVRAARTRRARVLCTGARVQRCTRCAAQARNTTAQAFVSARAHPHVRARNNRRAPSART